MAHPPLLVARLVDSTTDAGSATGTYSVRYKLPNKIRGLILSWFLPFLTSSGNTAFFPMSRLVRIDWDDRKGQVFTFVFLLMLPKWKTKET
jgi:hypothetical protein